MILNSKYIVTVNCILIGLHHKDIIREDVSNISSNISILELIFNKSLYLCSVVPYTNTCRKVLFEKLVVALLVKYISFNHKEELILLFSFPTEQISSLHICLILNA
jgi:hypothetical protein